MDTLKMLFEKVSILFLPHGCPDVNVVIDGVVRLDHDVGVSLESVNDVPSAVTKWRYIVILDIFVI